MLGVTGRMRLPQASPSHSIEEEMRLVRRVASGERNAFEQLYRRHHPGLTRFLVNLLRRPDLVEEVLNDTMMTLWSSAASFHGASKLSTWLFTIAHRKASRARGRWDMPVEDHWTDEGPSEEEGPDERLHIANRQKLLRDAMASLSDDHRTVVELTYHYDFGYKEIAEIMECPVDTIKSRMFYARRHLRAALAGGPNDWL